MLNSVTIGSGEHYATSILLLSIVGNKTIYHNKASYTIHDLCLGFEMIIFKDTEEGGHLANMIVSGAGLQEILEFLNHTLILNLHPSKLMKAVDATIEESFEKGRKAKEAEIRSALGL